MIKYCFSNIQKLKKYSPLKGKEPPKQVFPYQHPSNPLSKNIDIIQPQKKERFLSDTYETPNALYMIHGQQIQTGQLADQIAINIMLKREKVARTHPEQRFLCASIVGPPNSGKSSLLNSLVGQPIAAVSNKSNTTWDEFRGIHTDINSGVQIELIDTPGIISRYKYTRNFRSKAWDALEESNICLIVLDAVKTLDINMKGAMERLNQIKVDQKYLQNLYRASYSENENNLPQKSIEQPIPKILIFNKMDLCFNKRKLKWLQTEMEDLGKYDKVFYISVQSGYGLNELKEYLYEYSYDCKWKYDQSQYHIYTPIDQLQQMIRQAIFKRFYKEIPYIIDVNIKEFRITNKSNAKIIVQLNVQQQSQAKMVIGEKGRNLKQLKDEVEIQTAKVFKKIFDIHFQVTIKMGDKSEEFRAEDEDRKEHTFIKNDNQSYQSRKEQLNEQFEQFLNDN